jgi:hypothetical protein
MAVIGLHTVVKHQPVMGLDALAVCLHEDRILVLVGVDKPSADSHPLLMTMQAS